MVEESRSNAPQGAAVATPFTVVIPARFASTRLPGKALVDIGGKQLIQHVYQQVKKSQANKVIIATDDTRIEKVAREFGAEVCMTSDKHQSGTERIAEVVEKYQFEDDAIVVNVQGDEPMLPPELINQVADNLAQYTQAGMATLCAAIRHGEDFIDPNVVKVVTDQNGYALYFSRAPIPWDRNQYPSLEALIQQYRDQQYPARQYKQTSTDSYISSTHTPLPAQAYKHIGLYAYRASFIKDYVTWPASPLETLESLEQLRVLDRGHKIHVGVTELNPGIGVDTPTDLEKARALIK